MQLVSCIMPTANRRGFVSGAIREFLSQDYPNRELVIIDDGYDAVSDLVPPGGQVRYYRLDSKRTIGEKRNIAANAANGEVICHWDDDDYHGKGFLSDVVGRLDSTAADLTGYYSMYFIDEDNERAWLYRYCSQDFTIGTSMCYRKDLWERIRFKHQPIGEDCTFHGMALLDSKVVASEAGNHLVARIHGANTQSRRPMLLRNAGGEYFKPADFGEVKALLV